MGLQHIYCDHDLREKVFTILKNVIPKDTDSKNGRPGMDLWKILVMGTVRLNCNWDYDKLQEMVNNHRTLRQMLGHGMMDDDITYPLQTLKDSVLWTSLCLKIRSIPPCSSGSKNSWINRGCAWKLSGQKFSKWPPDLDRITLRCPKIPKDTDARIGVRNDPKNSARKQKIFGYNMVLSTSVEVHLKQELPVAVVNMAGNGKEGEKSST